MTALKDIHIEESRHGSAVFRGKTRLTLWARDPAETERRLRNIEAVLGAAAKLEERGCCLECGRDSFLHELSCPALAASKAEQAHESSVS